MKDRKSDKKPHTNPKYDRIYQIISQYETDKDHAKVKMWKLVLAAAQAKEAKRESTLVR